MPSPEEITEEFLKLKKEKRRMSLREAKKANPGIFGKVSRHQWMTLHVDNGLSEIRAKDRYPQRMTSQPAISKSVAYANFLKQRRQELAFAKSMISEEEITTSLIFEWYSLSENQRERYAEPQDDSNETTATTQPANDNTAEEVAKTEVPTAEEGSEHPAVMTKEAVENSDETHPGELVSLQCDDE